ncbi:unnamed protein product, partial [Ectocarpus sp. 8 AP-2014]
LCTSIEVNICKRVLQDDSSAGSGQSVQRAIFTPLTILVVFLERCSLHKCCCRIDHSFVHILQLEATRFHKPAVNCVFYRHVNLKTLGGIFFLYRCADDPLSSKQLRLCDTFSGFERQTHTSVR